MSSKPETKQCFGGPRDGEWLETPDTEFAAIQLPSGNLALYRDVGTRLTFDRIIPASALVDDIADMPRAQEPEL